MGRFENSISKEKDNTTKTKYFKIDQDIVLDCLFNGVWDLERKERQPISYLTKNYLVYEGEEIYISYLISDYGITWADFKDKDVAQEYYNSNKATEKQLILIKRICNVLCLREPTCLSKQQASDFISNHIKEYKEEMQKIYNATYGYVSDAQCEEYDCPGDYRFDTLDRLCWDAFEQH